MCLMMLEIITRKINFVHFVCLKINFVLKKYLNLEEFKTRNILTRFRVGMHQLEIERGRFFNINVEERICKLCKKECEDEIHFLLDCDKLGSVRGLLLGKY